MDADWLKPHSSRCLFHKLSPPKIYDVEMPIYSVSSDCEIRYLISSAIYMLELHCKKHLDMISHLF